VEKLLNLEEVADVLGVNYQTAYNLIRSGDIPAIRVGRLFRVEKSDLRAFIERSKKAVQYELATKMNPEGFICGACGRRSISNTGLPGTCEVCGKPLCTDCWIRLERRRCVEHREEAGGE
jgi:excisionase family DNA binding protein